MMMTKFRRATVLVALFPGTAIAGAFHDPAAIDARIVAALAGSGVTARPVDRRLKLATCPEPLRVDPPALGAVAVHCASVNWRIRVLVDNNATTATPLLIKRGDPVSVNFVAPGFSITTSGIAESEARAGERVRVRVEQKADPIMGEAIDVGSVRVGQLN